MCTCMQARRQEEEVTCPSACRLIDKKNARRYDDCISYSLVSAKKALKAAGLCQDANPDAVAKLDKTRAGAPCHPAPSRTLINALCDVG